MKNIPASTPPANTAPTTTTTAPATQTTVTPTTNTVQPVTTPQPVKVSPAPAATAASGLNPKHGMPGHRCDIPEGAPLNSQPASNIVPPQQAAQNNTVTGSKSQSVSIPQPATVVAKPAESAPVAPGMNPEHGKPGHRCDIAVGAPLNTPAK